MLTSEQQIKRLEKIFKPVLQWYEEKLKEDLDDSYLYDVTVEFMMDNISRSDAVDIIETLRGF